MKKTISFLVGIMLLLSFVPISLASSPPIPMPFVISVTSNGNAVQGLVVKLTFNTETIQKETNDLGKLMVDVGSGSPDFSSARTADSRYAVLKVDYGLGVQTYDLGSLDFPYTVSYEVSGSTKTCPDGTVIPSANTCPTVVQPVEDKGNSNTDNSIVSVEVEYGNDFDVILKNNKLSKLIDDVIEFASNDYEVHEEILVKGEIKTSLDDEDFADKPYLVLNEGGIQYKYVFDDLIDLSKIDTDEPLKINLLGKDVEIVKASASEIQMIQGTKFSVKEGETATYNSKSIKISAVGADYVYAEYGGEGKRIDLDSSGVIGDIEIYVSETIEDDDQTDFCSIVIGTDVFTTIKDGDEYADDSPFEYVIKLTGVGGYIGIINVEAYNDIDEDEDYKALTLGDKIDLLGFAIIKVNKVSSSDLTSVKLRVKDGYLYLKGDREDSFTVGSNEYKVLYLKDGQIYDEDKLLLTGTVISVGDSDIKITLESDRIKIGPNSLYIKYDMTDILYDAVSFIFKDQIYMDYEGIIFTDPEKAVEDKEGFEVQIPDEKPEVTITIGAESATELPPGECVVCPVCKDCPAVGDCPTVDCPSCPIVNCPPQNVCPPEKVCPIVPPEGNLGVIMAGILALIVGASGGIYFSKNKAVGKNVGVQIYKGLDGTDKIKHKHPTIVGYHDPKTVHTKEPHAKGEVLPNYQKDVSGLWKYIAG